MAFIMIGSKPIVVYLTSLYNVLYDVIPAKAGIQVKKTGSRIKSVMTTSENDYCYLTLVYSEPRCFTGGNN